MSSQGYPPPGQGPPQGWGQPQPQAQSEQQGQPAQQGWGQPQQQAQPQPQQQQAQPQPQQQQAQPQHPGAPQQQDWGQPAQQQQAQQGWGQPAQQQQAWGHAPQGQYGQGQYGQAPQGKAQYGMSPHAGSAMHGPMTAEARQFAVFIHLAQFGGYVVPLAGLVLPIVLWQIKKDDLPGIDAHGKAVANWIISEVIYAVVCAFLAFFVVGIFLLLALAVCSVVFTIIGAVKANNGEVWHYPLAIKFLK